ncbi:MAG: hypothetical protein LAT82_04625 [Nanoarchaeota archaeon]|nr:hypothetical protein [Nanoarchaeota archaeon]
MENFFVTYIFPNLHYYIGFLLLIIGFLVTSRVSPYMKKQMLGSFYDIFARFIITFFILFFLVFNDSSLLERVILVIFTYIASLFLVSYMYNEKISDILDRKTQLGSQNIFILSLIIISFIFKIVNMLNTDSTQKVVVNFMIGLMILFLVVIYLFYNFWRKREFKIKLKNKEILLGEIIREDSSFIQFKSGNKLYYIKKEDVEYVEEINEEEKSQK